MRSEILEMLSRSDVKNVFHDAVDRKVYNDIDIPIPLDNNYFINNNYTILLIMDALIKYNIIIEDLKYLDDFIHDLRMILKKMNNYNDITKGVNTLISKYVSRKLNIKKEKSDDSKEQILRYVYKKYIVDGYFYYGYSSVHKKEIQEYGIRKEGFFLDSRLKEVNDILKKYENKDIIKKVDANITDNLVVATYFSFIGPDYLEKIATSNIFEGSHYDDSFYYTKDVVAFKNNLKRYCDSRSFSIDEKKTIVYNLLNVWNEGNISKSKSCISFIKRESLGRNSLKDFEEIIRNIKDTPLVEALSMIMESRYTSYNLDEDINPSLIETIELPSYNDIIGNSSVYIELLDDEIEEVSDMISKKALANSYGFVSIFMFTGLLLISLGVVIAFILTVLGR